MRFRLTDCQDILADPPFGLLPTLSILSYFASFLLWYPACFVFVQERQGLHMEMLLMVGCMSLFGLAVTCLAFGAATNPEQTQEALPEHKPVTEPAPARFFATNVITPTGVVIPIPLAARTQVPIEALLLQIEGHVRLEQAAAESFLEYPTAALLHSRTMSPLIQ
jgi:hypothetical protein